MESTTPRRQDQLQLLGNEESVEWARNNANVLQGLLDGGVDNWADMEAKLIDAQEQMQQDLNEADHASSEYESDGMSSGMTTPVPKDEVYDPRRGRPMSDVSLGDFRPRRKEADVSPQIQKPRYSRPPSVKTTPAAPTAPARARSKQLSMDLGHDDVGPPPEMQSAPRSVAGPEPVVQVDDKQAEMVRTVASLQSEISRMVQSQQQRSELEADLQKARMLNTELASTVANLRSELAKEMEKYQSLHNEKIKTQADFEQSQRDADRLRDSINQQQAILGQKEQEIVTVNTRLREQQELLREKETEIAAKERKLVDENFAAELRFAALEKEKATLQAELDRHIELTASLKAQIQSKLLELQHSEVRIMALEREKSAMISELQRSNQLTEELKVVLAQKSKEANEFKTESAIQKERISVLESQHDALRMQNDSLTRMAEASKRAMEAKVETALSRAGVPAATARPADTAALMMLQAQLAQEQERYRTLHAGTSFQIAGFKKTLQTQSEELKQKVTDFKTKLNDATEEKRLLELKFKSLEDERNHLETEAASYRQQTERLESQMHETQVLLLFFELPCPFKLHVSDEDYAMFAIADRSYELEEASSDSASTGHGAAV